MWEWLTLMHGCLTWKVSSLVNKHTWQGKARVAKDKGERLDLREKEKREPKRMKSCVRTTPCFGGVVSGEEFAARGEDFQQLL